ncbi:putative glycosyltransferase family 25 protein [Rosellinia necatrix]|uniref:Putative glycosyltransferase family 25 protein n=1 Tax=Rosellinia necatrix TaxID=77044 RepID=A0A1W2TH77_ROSNE|nr:putative glycosyltransferase family 25 protein [Rosellinia necatrix]
MKGEFNFEQKNHLSPMRQPLRRAFIGLLIVFIVLGLLLGRQPRSEPRPEPHARPQNQRTGAPGVKNDGIDKAANDTLGFSKVFVVGLPERTDKRDALALTGALTGFHMEFIDGVKGESIPNKAVPAGVDRQALREENLGSWRGHMNAVRRIVEEGLESALIMEDDMDWDVRLKTQLEQIAKGARSIFPSRARPSSPYGDGWDVLWLGHCGEIFPETLPENAGKPEHPKFTIHNDKTVPPLSQITGLIDFKRYAEHTRWVHVSGGPICSFAYALSQSGARKVLLDLSVDHLGGAFDNALADFCRDGASGSEDGLQAKCISVTPPVFFHHRAKGQVTKDSDIQSKGDDEVREKGTTENIVWSARNNIRNLMLGLAMENQFAGEI